MSTKDQRDRNGAYPKDLVEYVHAAIGAYYEARVFHEMFKTTQNADPAYSEIHDIVEQWLETWREFGALLRVGGMDYVIVAHPYRPMTSPGDLREAAVHTLEAGNRFQALLARAAERGFTHPIISQVYSKLRELMDALIRVSDPA